MTDSDKIFEGFAQQRILVVGDIMIDRYLAGDVTRISPEAPVPVVELKTTKNHLGGAANVALNLAALGAKPHLCSIMGDDDYGKKLQEALNDNNLFTENIIKSGERTTTVKIRIMAGQQQLLRVDKEQTHDISVKEENELIARCKKMVMTHNINAVILQDYNKGVFTPKVISALLQLFSQERIPCITDPKKKNFLAYKNTSLFKPNLKEVQESLPFSVTPNLESLRKASAWIKQKLNNKHTMITLSEKGIYIDDEKNNYIMPTLPRNISDVCGAGDTVVSVAALGLAMKLGIKDIAVLSNLAGGQVCERAGVVPVNKEQMELEYRRLVAYKL